MILRVVSKYPKLYGFGSLWAKFVEGFDNSKHCEPCLIGTRYRQINKEIPINVNIIVPLKEMSIMYICGVSYPYKWENNFHLVLCGKEGSKVEAKTFNDVIFRINDAEAVYFDDNPAKERYFNRGRLFYTCRNFQFGVYYYEYLGNRQKNDQLEMFSGTKNNL